MGARADRLNRVLLALLGLLLLAAGALGLVLGIGAETDQWSDRRLLPDGTSDFVADNAGWLWPAVVVGAVVLSLLALRWLAQQLRTDRVDDVDLTVDRTAGETHVAVGAVTDALVAAVEDSPGVDDASARFISVRGHEQLLLHVRLADRTDLAAARRALAEGPVADLRRVLGDGAPEVVVELEPSTKGRGRVVV